MRMTKDEYKSRTAKDPQEGADYIVDPVIPGKVASVSENEVLIRFFVQPGSVIDTPFGKGTVKENENNYEIIIDAPVGRLVRTRGLVGRISENATRV